MTAPTLLAAAADTRGNTGQFVSLDVPSWAWVALLVLIVVLLLADLLLVHRTPHDVALREALIESAVWVTIGLASGLVLARTWGWQAAGSTTAAT